MVLKLNLDSGSVHKCLEYVQQNIIWSVQCSRCVLLMSGSRLVLNDVRPMFEHPSASMGRMEPRALRLSMRRRKWPR